MSDARADADDRDVQGDVMLLQFQHHPSQLSMDEIHRDLSASGPYERIQVDQAVRDLIRAGLLHRNGDFVFPTVAAVHMRSLPTS